MSTFWDGKRVFITGHTGFIGQWLTLWLSQFGAEITGFSHPDQAEGEILRHQAPLPNVKTIHSNILKSGALTDAVGEAKPEIVFHLAAQSLVPIGYQSPLNTYQTNVTGTINVLNAVSDLTTLKAIIVFTSDKVYQLNNRACDESAAIGGCCPYSTSKAAADIICLDYYHNHLAQANQGLATLRAGNVIGGGDINKTRLIPDILYALDNKTDITLRNPSAVRPWQSVFDLVAATVLLAEKLSEAPLSFSGSWNVGSHEPAVTVAQLVEHIKASQPELNIIKDKVSNYHENPHLEIDAAKLRQQLGFNHRHTLQDIIDWTLSWHRENIKGNGMADYSINQIQKYLASAK